MKGIAFVLLVLAGAGCGGSESQTSPSDAGPIYEAVLKLGHCSPAAKGPTYLQIDGADPSAELLARLRKDWPALKPASEMPPGQRHLVHFEGLRWIDANTAEVTAGFNTGIDGRIDLYQVIRKNGQWVLGETTNRAIS